MAHVDTVAPGLLSKDIQFKVATYTSGTLGTYALVDGLQSIPSLGGTPDKVEVTCLADGARRYINGIKDYGDLEFKFLYDNSSSTSNYRQLKALESETKVGCQVLLPDGTTFEFDAQLNVSLDEAEINTALTFTLNCGLQSDIDVTNPS